MITGLLGVGLAMWSVSVLGITFGRVFLAVWIVISGYYWTALSDHQFYVYQVTSIIALHGAIVGVSMNHRIKGRRFSWLPFCDVALVAIAILALSLVYRQPEF